MGSTTNIIVFGETGVGKSSVINLIAGRTIAKTSPDAPPCTMSNRLYTLSVSGRTLHIWETIGLAEPEISAKNYQPMIEQVCDLTQQLASKGGVDLLLFCFRPPRVTETVQDNYKLFHDVLCGSKVPIVLVITHLEREPSMENWWERNAPSLENCGIKDLAGHACVTGLPTHSKYRDSQKIVAELLKGHGASAARFHKPPVDWFIEVLPAFSRTSSTALKESAKKKAIIKVLTKRYDKMDTKRVTNLVKELAGV